MRIFEAWKKNKYRKLLLLEWVWQACKIYSVLDFGKMYYENVVYFNFKNNPKLNDVFVENISPDYIIPTFI